MNPRGKQWCQRKTFFCFKLHTLLCKIVALWLYFIKTSKYSLFSNIVAHCFVKLFSILQFQYHNIERENILFYWFQPTSSLYLLSTSDALKKLNISLIRSLWNIWIPEGIEFVIVDYWRWDTKIISIYIHLVDLELNLTIATRFILDIFLAITSFTFIKR